MNYPFKGIIYVGDRNLSKWADMEAGRQQARLSMRKHGPGEPVPQASGLFGDPDVGGQWQALLAQSKLGLMAGGPRHPPIRRRP